MTPRHIWPSRTAGATDNRQRTREDIISLVNRNITDRILHVAFCIQHATLESAYAMMERIGLPHCSSSIRDLNDPNGRVFMIYQLEHQITRGGSNTDEYMKLIQFMISVLEHLTSSVTVSTTVDPYKDVNFKKSDFIVKHYKIKGYSVSSLIDSISDEKVVGNDVKHVRPHTATGSGHVYIMGNGVAITDEMRSKGGRNPHTIASLHIAHNDRAESSGRRTAWMWFGKCQGFTSSEIAEKLDCSPDTVRFNLRRLKRDMPEVISDMMDGLLHGIVPKIEHDSLMEDLYKETTGRSDSDMAWWKGFCEELFLLIRDSFFVDEDKKISADEKARYFARTGKRIGGRRRCATAMKRMLVICMAFFRECRLVYNCLFEPFGYFYRPGGHIPYLQFAAD